MVDSETIGWHVIGIVAHGNVMLPYEKSMCGMITSWVMERWDGTWDMGQYHHLNYVLSQKSEISLAVA